MLHQANLVFIEVRYRGPTSMTDGATSITAAKRARIVHAANHFLACHQRFRRHCCRFDVVSVARPNYRPSSPAGFTCTWIRDAFNV
jgi:putative endonuclease